MEQHDEDESLADVEAAGGKAAADDWWETETSHRPFGKRAASLTAVGALGAAAIGFVGVQAATGSSGAGSAAASTASRGGPGAGGPGGRAATITKKLIDKSRSSCYEAFA